MSRSYSMSVHISGYNTAKVNDIQEAANEEWSFDDDNWYEYENNMSAVGEGNLYAGEGEEAFASRLTKAIWKANNAFCKVVVNATYLEELPYEQYELDKDQYKQMIEDEKENIAN